MLSPTFQGRVGRTQLRTNVLPGLRYCSCSDRWYGIARAFVPKADTPLPDLGFRQPPINAHEQLSTWV